MSDSCAYSDATTCSDRGAAQSAGMTFSAMRAVESTAKRTTPEAVSAASGVPPFRGNPGHTLAPFGR